MIGGITRRYPQHANKSSKRRRRRSRRSALLGFFFSLSLGNNQRSSRAIRESAAFFAAPGNLLFFFTFTISRAPINAPHKARLRPSPCSAAPTSAAPDHPFARDSGRLGASSPDSKKARRLR